MRYIKDISDTTNINDNKYLKYEKSIKVISRSLTSQTHLSKDIKDKRYIIVFSWFPVIFVKNRIWTSFVLKIKALEPWFCVCDCTIHLLDPYWQSKVFTLTTKARFQHLQFGELWKIFNKFQNKNDFQQFSDLEWSPWSTSNNCQQGRKILKFWGELTGLIYHYR